MRKRLQGQLGRETTEEGMRRGTVVRWETVAPPLPAPPAPPGAGTAPRRHRGSAGGCHWVAAGVRRLPPSLSPAASGTWPRSSPPFGYWGLPERCCHPKTPCPHHPPSPVISPWRITPRGGGKKRDEGGWCHEEVMGVTPKPLPTSKVAPHTVVEKLLGEAQGMGDVSCLGGGSREPVSIPVPTVRLHRAPG